MCGKTYHRHSKIRTTHSKSIFLLLQRETQEKMNKGIKEKSCGVGAQISPPRGKQTETYVREKSLIMQITRCPARGKPWKG